ncbi:MAG: hypothetical protein AABY10_00770, partial [Nanoarchaeota archaeon]
SLNLINKTLFTTPERSIMFANLNNGTYYYNVSVVDKLNSQNATERRNITLQQRVINPDVPNITFVSPTPSNGQTQTEKSVYINVSVTDKNYSITNCILKWNSLNISMTKTAGNQSVNCYVNQISLTNGSYTYKVLANNSQNLTGESVSRIVYITNNATPPINKIPPYMEIQISNKSKSVAVNGSILSLIKIIYSNQDPSPIKLFYIIRNSSNQVVHQESEDFNLEKSLIINKWLKAPAEEGNYKLKVILEYEDTNKEAEDSFSVKKSIVMPKINPLNVMVSIAIVIIIIVGLRLWNANYKGKK